MYHKKYNLQMCQWSFQQSIHIHSYNQLITENLTILTLGQLISGKNYSEKITRRT